MKEVNEKQKEILNACMIPRQNKWLKDNLIKNPTWLSTYLKDLQGRGYLKRNVETRLYQTTREGYNFLVQSGIIADAAVSTARIPLEAELPLGISEPRYGASFNYHSVPSLPKKEKATIEGFWYLDEAHKDKYNAIAVELEHNPSFEASVKNIFCDIGEGLGKVYGYKDQTGRPFWGIAPYSAREQHLKERASLDFKAGINLRFDGSSIVQKIPWEDLLKSDAEHDQEFEKSWKRQKQAIIKQDNIRKMYLESVVAENLVSLSGFGIQGENKEDAEKKFIQGIRREKDKFPISKTAVDRIRNHVPAERAVKEVLNDLQREGILKIAPKIIKTWVFEILDKNKLQEKQDKIWNELKKIQ
jgi:hypothetical protein